MLSDTIVDRSGYKNNILNELCDIFYFNTQHNHSILQYLFTLYYFNYSYGMLQHLEIIPLEQKINNFIY